MAAVGSKVRELSQPQASPQVPAPAPAPEPTAEEQAAESRRKNLLSRDRGLFGTVRTGFRGLLDLAEPFTPRKTLLGE